MSILFVFISTLIFSSVKSDKPPSVMCAYAGSGAKLPYKFSISDVPDRCEAILYGGNCFNVPPSEADTTAIKALVSAKKIVYMFYMFAENVNWTEIMTSPDPTIVDKQIAPMINYLNDNQVNGVILGYLGILAGEIPDYTSKIISLICKIKAGAPTVKIGLMVSGFGSNKNTGNKDVFDFSLTNPIVDLYVIDTLTNGYDCGASNDKVTLEKLCNVSSNSPMEQSKVLLYVLDLVVDYNSGALISYVQYCHGSGSGKWCANTMQLFYDEVNYVKKYFKGIVIFHLDYDDYDDSCGCGKFPVANTYIDAWQGKSMKCCDKI